MVTNFVIASQVGLFETLSQRVVSTSQHFVSKVGLFQTLSQKVVNGSQHFVKSSSVCEFCE
jgi:hypothetical protein